MSIAKTQAERGYAIYRNVDLDQTGIVIKASRGKVYGWFLYNNATAARFVKFTNSTTINPGATTVFLTIQLPASSAATVWFDGGIEFDTGICVYGAQLVADNDATDPNYISANIFYL